MVVVTHRMIAECRMNSDVESAAMYQTAVVPGYRRRSGFLRAAKRRTTDVRAGYRIAETMDGH